MCLLARVKYALELVDEARSGNESLLPLMWCLSLSFTSYSFFRILVLLRVLAVQSWVELSGLSQSSLDETGRSIHLSNKQVAE